MALSGGMDSAATVLWLREAGYRPRALFLDLLDSDTQRRQVQAAAEALGVALHIEPCAELFRHEIIDHTLAEHAAGRTPSPCARCNGRIKWRLLADTADRLGIFHIATGHYVRTIHHEGHSYFRRGADPAKDQSYYLWEVPEATIRRALLPLGDYTKEKVRRILRERYRLTELSARRESMGLCFLNGMRYGAFLQAHLPSGTIHPGDVVDPDGRIIGRHDGYPLYTAGQRRGFTLFPSSPAANATRDLAVRTTDATRNQVVVAPGESLKCREMLLSSCRAIDFDELLTADPSTLRLVVRGIGRNPLPGCRLEQLSPTLLRATLLHDTAWALSPGQPAVFYHADRLLGGGIITTH